MPVVLNQKDIGSARRSPTPPAPQKRCADVKQTIPCRAVPHRETFHKGFYNNQVILAYLTTDRIIVLSEELAVIQDIVCESAVNDYGDLRCISIGPQGTIAVGAGKAVLLYRPDVPGTKNDATSISPEIEWNRTGLLIHDFDVHTISFTCNGTQLLTGGDRLVMWKRTITAMTEKPKSVFDEVNDADIGEEKEWNIVWKENTNTLVWMCSVSPDGRYFCTAGRYDKLPKVWYRSFVNAEEDQVCYRFAYLPHPRAVSTMQWRAGRGVPGQVKNVLLTTARDHIARLWMETGTGLFATCAVIEGGPNHEFSWLHYQSYLQQSSSFYDGMGEVDTEANVDAGGRISSTPLRSALSEEWIVEVKRDLVVAFWHLNGLSESFARALPDVTLWLQTKVSSHDKFSRVARVMSVCREVSDDRSETPKKVDVYLINADGALCRWNFHVDEMVDARMASSTAVRCYGHSATVRSIVAHQQKPSSFLVSIDESNNLIKWTDSDSRLVDPFPLLRDIATEIPDVAAACFSHGTRNLYMLGSGLLQMHILATSPDGRTLSDSIGEAKLPVIDGCQDCTFYEIKEIRSESLKERGRFLVSYSKQTSSELFLCILHISFNPGSGVVLRVLSENAIPEDPTYSSLTSFDVSRERDGSKTFEVVTGHSDGKLFFWTVKGLEDNCSAILEECLVPISVIPSSPVVKVAIAYCGRIAFATADHWIFVFELESSGLQFSSEMEFDLLTPREREVESRTQSIRARVLLDWHELSHGDHLLAVGFRDCVRCFVQSNPTYLSTFGVEWKERILARGLPSDVTAMSFTANANLIFSVGTFMYALSRWTPFENTLEREPEAFNLIQYAPSLQCALPFYHPKVLIQPLIQDMIGGKLRRVTRALCHLEEFLTSHPDRSEEDDNFFAGCRIGKVPPLPIEELYADVDAGKVTQPSEKEEKPAEPKEDLNTEENHDPYAFLSPVAVPTEEHNSDAYAFLNTVPDDQHTENEDETGSNIAEDEDVEGEFTSVKARRLVHYLSRIRLPRMTAENQMHLLAVIDTVKDLKTKMAGLDECALRFMLSVRIHRFVTKNRLGVTAASLSTANATATVPSSTSAWAVHSDAQETLLTSCLPDIFNPQQRIKWADLRALGVGYWLTNGLCLRKVCEKLAKDQFLASREPSDCALMYIGLGKAKAVAALHKTKKEQKLADFMSNDFRLPRWKKAAVKNAYALLGKQRYEYASAFFILAGDAKSGLSILCKYTKDFQLPLVIARLLENGDDGPAFRHVMETYVMPIALQSNDFYLLSTAHWLLKQYDQAISALTGTGEDEDDVSRETPAPVSTKISTMRSSLYPSSSPLSSSAASSSKLDSSSLSRCSTPSTVTSRTSASAAESDGKKKVAFDPSAVHLFNYMRERPFLPQSEPSEKEERMLRRAIYAYARAGCSGLALELSHSLKRITEVLNAKRKEERKRKAEEDRVANDPFGGMTTPSDPFGGMTTPSDPFGGMTTPSDPFGGMTTPSDPFGGMTTPSDPFGGMTESNGGDPFGGLASSVDDDSANAKTEEKERLRESDTNEDSKEDDVPLSHSDIVVETLKQKMDALIAIQLLSTGFASEGIESRDTLDKDLAFLEGQQLEFAERDVMKEVNRYCAQNQFLLQQIRISSTPDEAEAYLKEEINLLAQLGVAISSMCRPISEDQARAIANRVQQIQRGAVFVLTLKGSLATELQDELEAAIRLGILVSAWVARHYRAIRLTLTAKPLLPFNHQMSEVMRDLQLGTYPYPPSLQDEDEWMDTSRIGSIPEEEMGVSDNFLRSLFRFFISRSFLESTSKSRRPRLWKESVMLWYSAVENAMKRTRILDGCDDETASRILSQGNVSLVLRELLKYSTLHRDKEVSKLWELLQSTVDMSAINRSFSRKVEREIPRRRGEIEFQKQPVRLFKDKDILQSFCLHPSEPNHYVVATEKGLLEFDSKQSSAPEARLSSPLSPFPRSSSSSHVSAPLSPTPSLLHPNSASPARASRNTVLGASGNLSSSVKAASIADVRMSSPSGGKSPLKRTRTPPNPSSQSPSTAASSSEWRRPKFSSIFAKKGDPLPTHSTMQATWLCSHPSQPYFLSASNEGGVHLWLFHHKDAVTCYRPNGPRISKIHFNQTGTKFGYCNDAGILALHSFITQPEQAAQNASGQTQLPKPYLSFSCHDKRAFDFTFLNFGSLVATAGHSSDSRSVKVWDVLVSREKALLSAFPVHARDGASSVIFSPRHGLLATGGKRGGLALLDMRTRTAVKTIPNAHDGNVKSLSLEESEERILISGSSDGNIRAWDIRMLEPVESWESVHEKQTFLRVLDTTTPPVFTYGVLKVQIAHDGLFSCGSDGRFLMRRYKT